MMRRLVLVVLAVALALARDAAAGPPTDQLRRSIDLVLQILSDQTLRTDARAAERRTKIRAVASDIFDFEEVSRRSLGRHWQGRTPAEREEFVRLFSDLLERSYVTKIEGYSGEKIRYAGELADGDQATVRTRIVTKQGTEIPVDYRMSRNGDRWRAHDVAIEGVSLVANYRTQFNAVVARGGYSELVSRLKAKQDEAASGSGTAAGRVGAPAPERGRSQSP